MSVTCPDCGAVASYGREIAHKSDCPSLNREPRMTLTDGRQIYPGHREIIQDGERKGQQQDYVVLAEEERAKGFVRPYCESYVHAAELGGCGAETRMGIALSETYACNPNFYGATYCVGCRMHRPVGERGEFYWTRRLDGKPWKVGT